MQYDKFTNGLLVLFLLSVCDKEPSHPRHLKAHSLLIGCVVLKGYVVGWQRRYCMCVLSSGEHGSVRKCFWSSNEPVSDRGRDSQVLPPGGSSLLSQGLLLGKSWILLYSRKSESEAELATSLHREIRGSTHFSLEGWHLEKGLCTPKC